MIYQLIGIDAVDRVLAPQCVGSGKPLARAALFEPENPTLLYEMRVLPLQKLFVVLPTGSTLVRDRRPRCELNVQFAMSFRKKNTAVLHVDTYVVFPVFVLISYVSTACPLDAEGQD